MRVPVVRITPLVDLDNLTPHQRCQLADGFELTAIRMTAELLKGEPWKGTRLVYVEVAE